MMISALAEDDVDEDNVSVNVNDRAVDIIHIT